MSKLHPLPCATALAAPLPWAPPLSPAAYRRFYALRKAASTQTPNTLAWLRAHSHALVAARSRLSVLSVGAGEGDLDLPFAAALADAGAELRYIAVEPNPCQRTGLARNLAGHRLAPSFVVEPRPFEELPLRAEHDLVLICHSAYYFEGQALPRLLRRAHASLRPGGSVLIIHQSPLGVPEIQARHMQALRGNRQTMLHSGELEALLEHDPALPYLAARDKHRIEAELDLRACLDPASAEGLEIMSFCLECELGAIAPPRVEALRRSFAELAGDALALREPVDLFWLRR